MGQGYSVIHPSAGSAGIDAPEVADLEFEKTLGGARFLKTVRARHKHGLVAVKVYTKPYSSLKLDDRIAQLIEERRRLADVPNALPYHRILDSNNSAYLVRQYVHSSLYDRISTNPPLEDIERKWIAFQLLCAIRDCHARNVYHGDIKTENMLVTSWNWLYLTDFASAVKPHFLPEDNPVDFTLFYDTTVRRICYIAPERFISDQSEENTATSHDLQWSMDMFSVGCVIAELFTEKPAFTLSQLFRYRKHEYDPRQVLLPTIKDDHIRDLVSHMISLDPNDRYSAQEYLDFWKDKAFPAYFYDFLHQYMHLITDVTGGWKTAAEVSPVACDDRIERVYNDYDKISYSLGFTAMVEKTSSNDQDNTLMLKVFPLQIDLPGQRCKVQGKLVAASDNGALLFSNVVIASLRSTSRAASKLKACELLLTFGEHLTDEAKLDRILPYAMALLEDDVAIVRISALRLITQLLSLVAVLSPMNAFIYPRYILPRLSKYVSGQAFLNSAADRATYAACLSDLALTAGRFLDMTQALRADGSLPSIDPEAEDDAAAYAALQISYDLTREDLIQQFEAQAKLFLTDADSAVKRAFLTSVGPLCVFFGQSLASDLILTHLNTYLNDEDWTLRCALCEIIGGVAAFVGGPSLEEFVLPLLVQALTDPEELVTEQVLRSLAGMAKLGLLSRWAMLGVVMVTARFAIHPNHWIREATAQLVVSSSTCLSAADFISLVQPLLQPVLRVGVVDEKEESLLDCLKKPLSRPVLELAKAWAARAERGEFWSAAKTTKNFSFDASSAKSVMDLYRGSENTPKPTRNTDDEQWLTRLRNAGMRAADEAKLIALRDYIWRTTSRTAKESSDRTDKELDSMMSLTTLQVPLQNVLFEEDLQYYEQISGNKERFGSVAPTAKETKSASLDTNADHIGEINDTSLSGSVAPAVQKDNTSMSAIASAPKAGLGGRQRVNSLLAKPESILSSSPTSARSQDSRNPANFRLRDQAMGLMRKTEMAKAGPEISTDSATAAGHMNMPASGQQTPVRGTAPTANVQPRRIQDLTNKNVKTQINRHFVNNFPVDIADFGPRVQNLRRTQIPAPGGTSITARWKPAGILLAVLDEHSAAIDCAAVAPDHTFFLSGSADGTVKIWDTARLENNVAHRSRQTYQHRSGAAITALAFIEGTHSFISCARDGSLNVIKVDVDASDSGKDLRYGKLSIVRSWSLADALLSNDIKDEEDREHIICVQQGRLDGQSQCFILTSKGRFVVINLKDMSLLLCLEAPVSHGSPTAFCVGRRWQWVVIGTDHGVLDLWDLRFQLRLKSWTFRNPAAITKLTVHPGQRSSHRMKICMSGGTGAGHVSVWDLEKMVCNEVYHPSAAGVTPGMTIRDVEIVMIDDDKPGKQLDSLLKPRESTSKTSSAVTSPTQSVDNRSGSVQDFVIQMHVSSDGSTPANEARYHFLITAGPEWKTRFWDGEKPANSTLINNAAIDSYTTATPSETMHVNTTFVGAETKVYTDAPPTPSTTHQSSTLGIPSDSPSKSRRSHGASRSVSSMSVASTAVQKPKLARYDIIRDSAKHLLRGHRDEVTCVALVEKPFGMVVTGDRSGALYVFQ